MKDSLNETSTVVVLPEKNHFSFIWDVIKEFKILTKYRWKKSMSA